MRDLNDLFLYVQVVDQRGFAPAGRALGMPKSRLSRRITLLEERLGVQLIHRSTRRFAVTEIGQDTTGTASPCWSKQMRQRKRSTGPGSRALLTAREQ